MTRSKKEYLTVAVVEDVAGMDEEAVTASPVEHTLEIVAPLDLKEGVQFEVLFKGQRFIVTVPPGGVSRGQQFSAQGCLAVSMPNTVIRWKTGLFDCFRHGICHPHCCMSFWCTGIALAQVMTRMRLTWLGGPGSIQQVASTFKTVAGVYILVILLDITLQASLFFLVNSVDAENHNEDDVVAGESQGEYASNLQTAAVLNGVRQLIELIVGIYFLVVMIRTRMAVRQQNNIPEESCRGCDDCCCFCFCRSCSVAQMMRETADYDEYPASCCTDTGLPPQVHVV